MFHYVISSAHVNAVGEASADPLNAPILFTVYGHTYIYTCIGCVKNATTLNICYEEKTARIMVHSSSQIADINSIFKKVTSSTEPHLKAKLGRFLSKSPFMQMAVFAECSIGTTLKSTLIQCSLVHYYNNVAEKIAQRW